MASGFLPELAVEVGAGTNLFDGPVIVERRRARRRQRPDWSRSQACEFKMAPRIATGPLFD